MLFHILGIIFIILVAFFLGCIWQNHQINKRMNALTSEINHFILYSEHLDESLAEGSLHTLSNQIRQLEAQLLHERRAAILREEDFTKFTENMAHQMKTVLTAAQLHLDLTLAHASDSKELESLGKLQEDLQRLTDELNWILKSSQLADKKVAMHFEDFKTNDLLSECLQQLDSVASKRCVFISYDLSEHLMIHGDYFWLLQAIENVLKNAIEHSPENGTVTVSVKDLKKEIQICIKDAGSGIATEELPCLFKRYHRGNYSKSGYGIGLHMAADIIKAHHGTITAGNNLDKGAYFIIALPQMNGSAIYT